VPSRHNGITFCTGSHGSTPDNDLFEIIELAKERIHSVHDGSLDMVGIVEKLIESGVDVPIRPNHGRMIWGETGRPGYGLYDRALGAAYLNGIIDTVNRK
jgi:mannonate dehydratase